MEAAVAILHALAEDSILLIRRAERADDPWSGQWSLPGGRRDPEDSDLLATALRELEEECGIRLPREQLDTAMPVRLARRRAGRYVPVAPFLFKVERELVAVVDRREAVEAHWLKRAVLLDAGMHCLSEVPGMPANLHFPVVEMHLPMPLWGFTYRLLTDWLELGPQVGQVEAAGLAVAAQLLDFLRSSGLEVEHGWRDGEPQIGAAVRFASVRGKIPVERVLKEFARPGGHIAAVNCLEVHADRIRLVGPAFEEYFIEATPTG